MSVKHKELVHISQDELNKLEGDYVPKCKYCGKSIWYDNTKISYRLDGRLSSEFRGTTYRTIKMMDNIPHHICVCQKCMEKKYPEFADKNISKIFNTFNKYASYAFDIPYDDMKMKNKLSAVTLENFIRKYGEEDGKLRFDEYRKKQAYSNSFEYKNMKYGWTNDEFNKFNQSRAVTLENLIKKHGEVEGRKIWDNYLKRQSETSTNEYLFENFSEYDAETILLLKSGKLDGFIRKYGEVEGKIKYDKFIQFINDSSEKTNKYHQSKRGMMFFEKLIKKLSECGINYEYNYGDNEIRKYSHIDEVLYSLDFYIVELNICIEFNGDYWHANPEMYKEDWYHPIKKMYAKDIWEYDNNRSNSLKSEYDIDVITVWEKSLYIDGDEDLIINKIVDKIKYVSANKENRKNQ